MRSTSMISKSMPFSYSTIRQRWEKGSVIPEYSVIMLFDVFPEFVLEHQRHDRERGEQEEREDAPELAVVLRRLPHVRKEIHEVGGVLVVLDARKAARLLEH